MKAEQAAQLAPRLEAIAAGAPSNGTDPDAAPWPPLAPELPGFPLDALPAALRAWVAATAQATQTPPDLSAWAALGVLAAAVMGAVTVDCGTWDEELALYAVVAMPSGDRKSAVLRAATAPLRAVEQDRVEAARPAVAQARSEREATEQRRKNLTTKAAKTDDPSERAALAREAGELAAQLEAEPEPRVPRLLADDATPEALAGLLAAHGRIAVLAAESALLDNLSGRYADGRSNLHLVCQAYSGEATTVDRRGSGAESLERPLLTIALTIQPVYLARLVGDELAREQGLVARCVLVQPTSLLGSRSVDAPPVPKHVEERWRALVARFADIATADTTDSGGSVGSVGTSEGFTVALDDEARALLDDLRATIEPRLAPAGDLRPVAAWVNRHPGRIARLAALLHLAEHPPAEPVSAATMRAALDIGAYTLAHALAALTGHDEQTRAATRWLGAHGL